MNLKRYMNMRDFSKTDEPQGGISRDKNHLMFVVQEHHSSHLHYDFRLEMEGVLKSWAVPKGPSTDPKMKHLAVMVEDHPLAYINFEGIIPQGEYGAGSVIVWDRGVYEPMVGIEGKFAQEKYLLNQLESGTLNIKLNGIKLKGEFALVKTQGMGDNGWLLIKHNDIYASHSDVTLQNRSILSNLTVEEIRVTGNEVGQYITP